MKVRSRPPTVPTLCVASPIGSAATAVPKSASAAPIVQCGTVVSAMISGLRFARAKPYHAGREPDPRLSPAPWARRSEIRFVGLRNRMEILIEVIHTGAFGANHLPHRHLVLA